MTCHSLGEHCSAYAGIRAPIRPHKIRSLNPLPRSWPLLLLDTNVWSKRSVGLVHIVIRGITRFIVYLAFYLDLIRVTTQTTASPLTSELVFCLLFYDFLLVIFFPCLGRRFQTYIISRVREGKFVLL